MLKTIRLKNFKLHEDTQIDAAPITVFIGPNNSGKSSIFQSLLLLRQAAARNDQWLCQPPAGIQPAPPDHYLYSSNILVDVGAFDEVVRKGYNEIDVQATGDVRPHRASSRLKETSLSFETRIRGNRLVFNSGVITCGLSQANWALVEGVPPSTVRVPLTLGEVTYFIQAQDSFKLIQPSAYQVRDGNYRLPHELQLEYNEALQWFGAVPQNLLESLHPVYALRGFEEWGCPITDPPDPSLALMTLNDRAIALPNALAADPELKRMLSERLEKLLNISVDFQSILGKKFKIWARHTNHGRGDTLLANEGTGANQLPFILVPILVCPENETILLSEPEAHLHPKAQCDLTRILLSVARNENIQFFFETHSEHVLHVILNAVAKGEWNRDQVALYYFQNKNGVADVSRREINQFGQVEGGLPDFFEQNLKELTEYLDALGKH